MPGVRDRNLRSGDLHEELGLLLLRSVALVAPVPRPEDVGTDAFATLVRPDGSRRLLPDLSFLVQLKAASKSVVSYEDADAVNWLRNLEIPLLIGRVNLPEARIELFTTLQVQRLFLEGSHSAIHLLLDPDESPPPGATGRWSPLGPPIHRWSLADAAQPNFLLDAHSVLRPHIEALALNRRLRDIQYQEHFEWQTGQPPRGGAWMISGAPGDDIRTTLRGMVPHVRRLLLELESRKRYADFPILVGFVRMMRRWGVEADPDNLSLRIAAMQACGPEISDEEAIRWRYEAKLQEGVLFLGNTQFSEASLAAIPEGVKCVNLIDAAITDAAIPHLLKLKDLSRLILSGTAVTDTSLELLGALPNLRYLAVERTAITDVGIAALNALRPDIEVMR